MDFLQRFFDHKGRDRVNVEAARAAAKGRWKVVKTAFFNKAFGMKEIKDVADELD